MPDGIRLCRRGGLYPGRFIPDKSDGWIAVLGNFGTGRARDSVRAVVVNPHARIGNGGG